MRQSQSSKPSTVNDTNTTPRGGIDVRSMPDPEDIYSTTLGASDTSQSFVHIPDIRNGDGETIQPQQYEMKLHDGDIVMVNVYLRLYVLSTLPHHKKKTNNENTDGICQRLILIIDRTLPMLERKAMKTASGSIKSC